MLQVLPSHFFESYPGLQSLWKLEGLGYQIKLLPVRTRGSVHLGQGLGPGHYTPRPINGELDWAWQGPGMPGCWPSLRFQLTPCLERVCYYTVLAESRMGPASEQGALDLGTVGLHVFP